MNIPDLVNGLFELSGGLFILNHCRVLYGDKKVNGVSILSTVFFLMWGYWNIFYYPHLDQWFSFVGGLLIAAANMLWVSMLIYYKRFYTFDVEKELTDTIADEIRKEIDAEVLSKLTRQFTATYTVNSDDIK